MRQNYAFDGRAIQRSTVERIQADLGEYPQKINPAWETFLNYYNFSLDNFENISVGRVVREDYPYGVMILGLEQTDAKGAVFLVHGYLDHSSLNAIFMTYLYDQGWNVYGVDMPGHGFSSGKRARIEDFNEYGQMLDLAISQISADQQTPILLMGHSTGGSAVMNFLLTQDYNKVSGACLFAPLVQPKSWVLANVGMFLLDWAVEEVPGGGTSHSSNPAFLEFSKQQDPLLIDKVDLAWVRATRDWIEDFKVFTPGPDIPLIVIQGTEDHVVYAEYNLPEIKRVFPQAEILWVPDGYHSLLNEPREIRQLVFSYVSDFLYRF
jgi:alpha-beta hydrolase superfamily lysophospholipase